MHFSRVSLEIQNKYNDLFRKTPQPASDYSFANIYGWTDEYGLEIAFAHGLAWVRQTRPQTLYWAPVGDWDLDWKAVFREIPAGTSLVRIP